MLETTDGTVPITLMNHSPPLIYEIICGVVERCSDKGLNIREIILDPLVAKTMGLAEGDNIPIHTATRVCYRPDFGRQILFRK